MVDAEGEVAQPLRQRQRHVALGRKLVRGRERPLEHGVGDRVDEADAQGLLRVDGAP